MRRRPARTNRIVLSVLAGAVLVAMVIVSFVAGPAHRGEPQVSGEVSRYTAAPQVKEPFALVIGDSQANGAGGITTRRTWVSQGLNRTGYLPVVEGYGGTGFVHDRAATETADGHPNYLTSLRENLYDLPEKQVELIIFQGGGNDGTEKDDDIRSAADQAIGLLRDRYPDAKLVMVGSLNQKGNPTSRRESLSRLWGEIAAEHQGVAIDTTDWVMDHDLGGNLLGDGVHFDQEGHDRVGELFAEALTEAGLNAGN